MRLPTTLILIALMSVMAACSGGDQSGESGTAQLAETNQAQVEAQSHGAISKTRQTVAQLEGRQLEEGSQVTVVGTLGCGHCTYHVGETCSAAIKTNDGMVFILDVAEQSEWFRQRYDGTELEVTGTVRHQGTGVILETSTITEL